MIQKDSFWLRIRPPCFSHNRSHAFVRSHQFPTWVGRSVVLLKSISRTAWCDVRSANKKYLRKFVRLAGCQSFYFKWSKFALKRCNQNLSGNKMQIWSDMIRYDQIWSDMISYDQLLSREEVLRQDKKISLEAAPPLIRISLWPTEHGEQRTKLKTFDQTKHCSVFVWVGRPESRQNHRQQHLQRARQLAPEKIAKKKERRHGGQFGNKRWHVLGFLWWWSCSKMALPMRVRVPGTKWLRPVLI